MWGSLLSQWLIITICYMYYSKAWRCPTKDKAHSLPCARGCTNKQYYTLNSQDSQGTGERKYNPPSTDKQRGHTGTLGQSQEISSPFYRKNSQMKSNSESGTALRAPGLHFSALTTRPFGICRNRPIGPFKKS